MTKQFLFGFLVASLLSAGYVALKYISDEEMAVDIDQVFKPCTILTVPNAVSDTIPQYSHIKGKMLPPGTYTYATRNSTGRNKLWIDLGFDIYELITDSLHFERIDVWEDADIKIAANDAGGSRAYTGTDIFLIDAYDPQQPTMWLGKPIYHAYDLYVLIHELGHNLGLAHEHPNPKNGIKWRRKLMYDEVFSKSPYNWTWERANVWFDGFDPEKYELSEFDAESAWLYYYPCKYTLDSIGCGKINYFFSRGDIKGLQSDYGNPFKDN